MAPAISSIKALNWSQDRKLTRKDAREIAANIIGFVKALREMAQENRAWLELTFDNHFSDGNEQGFAGLLIGCKQ